MHDRVSRRLSFRRQVRKRRPSKFEALESRHLLTTFYVDNVLLLTADRDHSGRLSSGDQVTFGNGQSYQQADLTYDAAPLDGDVSTAFSSIGQALASPLVQPGDTIDIAGGTYTESGLTIDKDLTLQGLGSVIVAAPQGNTQTELSIIDQPATVALTNLTIQTYQTILSDSGGGTLDLTDVSLFDGETSINNVENLNVASHATTPQKVGIGPVIYVQPLPSAADTTGTNSNSAPDSLGIDVKGGASLTFTGVKNVLFQTGAGSQDTITVSPLPDATVTIDGGNIASQGSPGDTLDLPTNFYAGSPLAATSDSSGISGTWTPSGAPTVSFSHMQSLLPGIAPRNVSDVVGAQGADTGSQVVAEFTDPVANPLTAGDAA
ncbi:MAG TPA: hypothetical protein VND64_36885, partial [Pirellulales bacterium]|nr:hypothetical protein [Pirellulales bacterium]